MGWEEGETPGEAQHALSEGQTKPTGAHLTPQLNGKRAFPSCSMLPCHQAPEGAIHAESHVCGAPCSCANRLILSPHTPCLPGLFSGIHTGDSFVFSIHLLKGQVGLSAQGDVGGPRIMTLLSHSLLFITQGQEAQVLRRSWSHLDTPLETPTCLKSSDLHPVPLPPKAPLPS